MEDFIRQCSTPRELIELAHHTPGLSKEEQMHVLRKAQELRDEFTDDEWIELLLVAPPGSKLEALILKHVDPDVQIY